MRRIRDDHLGASTFLEKGWHLIALGDYAAAEGVLQKAVALAPSDNQARALLAWAQMRQGRYDEALVLLESVLAAEPMNGLARANRGYVCLRKGLLREARENLDLATRQTRDPRAALYGNFYLGLLHASQGDVAAAQRCFERCISRAPNFVEARYELGRAHWLARELGEAERAWKAGQSANRFNVWGRRCGEAIRHVRAGQEPRSYS